MCLTKVYYNTYADGAQDITEKSYPCRDGRSCSRPDMRRYDRKFPFTKLGDAQGESHRSLSERKPTPYFSGYTPRSANASSKHYDYRDPYAGGYNAYDYLGGSSTRHDPRDSRESRYDRDREQPRLKRSSTNPHIVYMDRDHDGGMSSRSRSRSSSRDIPLGLVPLADEYGRRHRRHSHSSSRERDSSDYSQSGLYYTGATPSTRRRTDDPHGYVLYDDADERRRRHRRGEDKKRRMSASSYMDPTSSATLPLSMMDPYSSAYLPRRASTTVVHNHSDGSDSMGSGSGSGSSGRKQLRWEDEVRARRDRHNAEIASRPPLSALSTTGDLKGILKRSASDPKRTSKGKGRDVEDIAELRRAIERMEIPRGRDREPRGRDEWDWGGGSGRGGYGFEDLEGGRRKRSRVYADDAYRY
ncbi:hypothetical protein VTI28DRAFT_8092 [Corynascus sepedonium]